MADSPSKPNQQPREPELVNLISEAQNGDPTAIGQLLHRYRNYLLLIANHHISDDLKAKVGASDVVQQSMLNAQLHFGQFQGNSEPELKAWLGKIVQNDILKTRRTFNTRKRDSQQEINLQEHSAVGRRLLDEHPTPTQQAIQREKARLLNCAMLKLSEDHQRVIRLRNFEQLSFEEIGEHLGRTADASRKLWSRAIQVLQVNLAGQEEELLTGAAASSKLCERKDRAR